jgi:hypothetical protein
MTEAGAQLDCGITGPPAALPGARAAKRPLPAAADALNLKQFSGECPDSEVRTILPQARLRTSESKDTSNLLI